MTTKFSSVGSGSTLPRRAPREAAEHSGLSNRVVHVAIVHAHPSSMLACELQRKERTLLTSVSDLLRHSIASHADLCIQRLRKDHTQRQILIWFVGKSSAPA